jgi:hypothetical protein
VCGVCRLTSSRSDEGSRGFEAKDHLKGLNAVLRARRDRIRQPRLLEQRPYLHIVGLGRGAVRARQVGGSEALLTSLRVGGAHGCEMVERTSTGLCRAGRGARQEERGDRSCLANA